MPLLPGRKNISRNISELTHHGSRPRSHAQIVAIALSEADRHPRANGGSAAVDAAVRITRAAGGRSPYGFTVGDGGGRTDKNNIDVGAGSYILPADVVAGLGDGNSLAGARVWDQILASMPWGIAVPRSTGRRSLPAPSPPHDAMLAQGITGVQREPISPTLADGGNIDGETVPIASADGEIAISPEDVLRVGQHYSPQADLEKYPGTHKRIMRRGHRVLDAFTKEVRGRTIRHLRGLRGPVGSKDPQKGHV